MVVIGHGRTLMAEPFEATADCRSTLGPQARSGTIVGCTDTQVVLVFCRRRSTLGAGGQ